GEYRPRSYSPQPREIHHIHRWTGVQFLFTSPDRSRPSPQPEGASALAMTPSRSVVVLAPWLTPAVTPPRSAWLLVVAPAKSAWVVVGPRSRLVVASWAPVVGSFPPRDQPARGPTEPRTSNGVSVSGRAAP